MPQWQSRRWLRKTAVCHAGSSLLLLGGLALRRIGQSGDTNAQSIEDDHRRSNNAHTHDVRGRRDDSRDDKADKDCVTNIAPEKARTHNTHQSQKKDNDRFLKNEAKAKNHGHQQVGVFAYCDHLLKLRTEADEKIHRIRKDDAVAEITAAQEKADGCHHEGDNITLLFAIQS